MPAFSNPVVGAIKPHGSPAVYGSFRVTAPFGAIDTDHPTAHEGVDVGNMKCGDPILAMSDGIVAEAFTSKKGSIIIRVSSTEYPGYQFAAAHVAGIEVVKGQRLKRGQPYAHIGKTGTTACHLHGGMKLNGVEIDWLPLLGTVAPENVMPGFKIGSNIGTFTFTGVHALISPTDTKVPYMQVANAGPFDVAASLDLKTPAGVPVDIDGNSPPRNNRDQVYLVDAPRFGVAAYALRQDGTFTPAKSTEDELNKAREGGIQAARAALAALK